MKKSLELLLFILALCYSQLTYAQELFICKNAFIKEPIDHKQIMEFRESQSYYFRPGNRIVAVFVFYPEKDSELEFRWISDFKERDVSPCFHHVKKSSPVEEYTAFAWITLDSTILDGILGSKYTGNWRLEVYLDKKKVASRAFQVM